MRPLGVQNWRWARDPRGSTVWNPHVVLQDMRAHLEELKRLGIEAIKTELPRTDHGP